MRPLKTIIAGNGLSGASLAPSAVPTTQEKLSTRLHIAESSCFLPPSRGYLAMGKQMLANGGNTFAFFTRNPRGGKAKDIDPQDVQAFGQLAEENHFGKLVAHAPYTMNCCAAKENLRDFAREIMADDLRRLEMTPGNYYNFHPGSHVGQGAEVGISKIAEILNEVLTKDQSTIVLLETMSGKGTEVGRNFEELRQIIDRVELKDKLGVCLDTCHVWELTLDETETLFHEFGHALHFLFHDVKYRGLSVKTSP